MNEAARLYALELARLDPVLRSKPMKDDKPLSGGVILTCPYCGYTSDYNNPDRHTQCASCGTFIVEDCEGDDDKPEDDYDEDEAYSYYLQIRDDHDRAVGKV